MTTSLHQDHVNPDGAGETGQYLQEMKALERQFMLVRWAGVAAILIQAWLHNPISTGGMIASGGVAGIYNAVVCLLNPRIKSRNAQRALGISILTLDVIVVWSVIYLFAREFYTAAYAGFALVIIEGAIRFGLVGSLAMALVFAIGLFGATMFREAAFGVRFSTSGFIFWTILMSLIALAVGMVTNQARTHRQQSERLVEEKTLILERQRISNELHDTVLKTLQGLALEARVLRDKTHVASFVEQTARYIEEICSRSGAEIRDVIFELRSEEQESGIGFQMSRTLDAWSKDTGIASEFVLMGADQKVSPKIRHNLLRILTEALANVQEHASASRVSVSLNLLSDKINLEISDNGHGLDIDTSDLYSMVASGKLGIITMKERAELAGGKFSLESDRGGTRISITVPLCSKSSNRGQE